MKMAVMIIVLKSIIISGRTLAVKTVDEYAVTIELPPKNIEISWWQLSVF
tara:strand:+ start:7950 stop:8099 length:150 start_codon:yes stop_codon:yes gene_type:complete